MMVDLLQPEGGEPCLAVTGLPPGAVREVEWVPKQRLMTLVIAEEQSERAELMPTQIGEGFVDSLTALAELAILALDSGESGLKAHRVPLTRHPQ